MSPIFEILQENILRHKQLTTMQTSKDFIAERILKFIKRQKAEKWQKPTENFFKKSMKYNQ